jgi:hypothetical protein
MTAHEEVVQALRECMSALDMCLNSSDIAAALEEADRVLTTYRPLLQRLAD